MTPEPDLDTVPQHDEEVEDELVEEELVIEEISIDGMCGVY
jgi:mycofactocin precursor